MTNSVISGGGAVVLQVGDEEFDAAFDLVADLAMDGDIVSVGILDFPFDDFGEWIAAIGKRGQQVAAHVDDDIISGGDGGLKILGELISQIDAFLEHRFAGFTGDGVDGGQSSTCGVDDFSAVVTGETLGHLAAAAISEADEQDVLHSLLRNSR